MMVSKEDIAIRANAAATGLTDVERIALGYVLIDGARDPDCWLSLRNAAYLIRDKSDTYLNAALRGADAAAEVAPTMTAPATTHEQLAASSPRSRLPSPGAAWTRIKEAERALSESLLGDFLGMVLVVIACVGVIYIGAFLQ